MTNNINSQLDNMVPPITRFVVSNRRAGKKRKLDKLKASRAKFESSFSSVMAASVHVLSQNEEVKEEKRGIKIFDADYLAVNKMKREMPADTIVERIITRKITPVPLFETSLSAFQPLGKGNTIEFFAKSNGKPLAGIGVKVTFSTKDDPSVSTPGHNSTEERETDDQGKAVFDYDDDVWKPVGVMFEPKGDYWTPKPGAPTDSDISFTPLPKTGPLGWWHNTVGVLDYNPNRGAGIKIGVIDTGVGPHPYLSNVKSIGAFIGGQYDSDPKAGQDSANHGTHVCGIIAAQPPLESNCYSGITPAAEVCAARVFPPGLSATQVDIADAIDTLASEQRVHLINLSLGSGRPSEIELDAIRFAMEHGTLCICAAGNNFGNKVLFPAAYNETVAVSSLGVLGMYPADSLSAAFIPQEPDKFSANGLFLASYSNVGLEIVCCAPGTGIISTVPAAPGYNAPYLAMDGTSMASPLATGTIGAILSANAQYMNLPADQERFKLAVGTLVAASSHSLNLSSKYQGFGLIRT